MIKTMNTTITAPDPMVTITLIIVHVPACDHHAPVELVDSEVTFPAEVKVVGVELVTP